MAETTEITFAWRDFQEQPKALATAIHYSFKNNTVYNVSLKKKYHIHSGMMYLWLSWLFSVVDIYAGVTYLWLTKLFRVVDIYAGVRYLWLT